LNRGRHLCSAGRPSGWALAHIPVRNMVQHYVRKSTCQSWTVDAMGSAIQEVASGVSVRSAARHHNIPRNTLKHRVLKKNKQVHGSDKGWGHLHCLP